MKVVKKQTNEFIQQSFKRIEDNNDLEENKKQDLFKNKDNSKSVLMEEYLRNKREEELNN